MSGPTATSSSQALARITAAPVPGRVRQLLEAIHGTLAQVLGTPLLLVGSQLERELFNLAEKARSSQAQADLYAQIRLLKEGAREFPTMFLDGMAGELAGLHEPHSSEPAAARVPTMTLVADRDIDRDIVLHEMARRESHRAQSHLQLLSQRFGVLTAQPAFDVERLPVGPYALCRVLRDCGERMELDLQAQLQLYQVFERTVLERHVELLDRLNILLAHEGVLPGLVYAPYFPRPSAPRRGGPAAQSAEPTATPQRPLTQWQGQAPAASWSAAALASDIPQAGGGLPPAPGAAMPPGSGSGNAVSGMAALHELLNNVRQQLSPASATSGHTPDGNAGTAMDLAALAGQPGTAGAGIPGGNAGLPPSAQEGTGSATPAGTAGKPAPVPLQAVPSHTVMDMLGRLQGQAPAPGTRHNLGDIRMALLSQMRAEHGEGAAFSIRDSNTLDLLGLLYSQIQREVRTEGPAADLLGRLQVPVARAAIGDDAFFVRDKHPARELLNTVAESGAVWLGEDDSDPALLQKLDEVVQHVVEEYQGDEAVFADANQQIQAHLVAAARKAEVTERRQVEAARGKERLEAAKQLASRTIDQLCREAAPPKFVQTLLHQAWSDALTLTLLRQGEDSDEWRQRQETTARIGEVTSAGSGGEPDQALGKEVEESLLQVGYHRDEAAAIARRLSTPGGEDEITSRTELATRLKARTRLGAGGNKDDDEPSHAAKAERTPTEEKFYQQLRTLPFGTWFEFTTNQQGDTRRLRLSWYSLITDHSLFVNQRGQKVAEHTLDALSRLMAKGQLNIVTEDRGRLIDRAWQATLRTLRSLTGSATTPEAAA